MIFQLKNGLSIPAPGFGTWKLKNEESTIAVIEQAIASGYRHIDTASAYGNEQFIGKGIQSSGIPREELFITGKLWNSDRDYDSAIKACKKTIENLGCTYLDLYLIHWPASPAVHNDWIKINQVAWQAMEDLYKSGLVKAIGVCNFKKEQLEQLFLSAHTMPMVNQIEFHPGQRQEETVEFCFEKGMIVEAWSPLGSGKMLKKEVLQNMALNYQVSTAQLCIKWCLQNGVLPIPKSEDPTRMAMNLDLNFRISKEDMDEMNEFPFMGGSGLDSETVTLFN